MVDAHDPLTGEKVSASINVWSHVTDLWSQGIVDTARYIRGELTTSDITEGTYVRDWASAAEAATTKGTLPMLTSEARLEMLGKMTKGRAITKEELEAFQASPMFAKAREVQLAARIAMTVKQVGVGERWPSAGSHVGLHGGDDPVTFFRRQAFASHQPLNDEHERQGGQVEQVGEGRPQGGRCEQVEEHRSSGTGEEEQGPGNGDLACVADDRGARRRMQDHGEGGACRGAATRQAVTEIAGQGQVGAQVLEQVEMGQVVPHQGPQQQGAADACKAPQQRGGQAEAPFEQVDQQGGGRQKGKQGRPRGCVRVSTDVVGQCIVGKDCASCQQSGCEGAGPSRHAALEAAT